MWLEGFTATQISEELGGVSRNAVIGKAHRLGLESRSFITPPMFGKVSDLPISVRAKSVMRRDNIIYVGDLVQHTEAELIRFPNAGRNTLTEVRDALASIGLRLGMRLANWPPDNIEEAVTKWEAAQRASELHQTRGGATFHPVDDHFAMSTLGDEGDLTASQKPMNQQMQSALLQKARDFSDIAKRLDNQSGWNGISRTVATLAQLLDRDASEIPSVLGYLYPAAIELGSFIELDQQLSAKGNSFATPLDPEVRRPLSDFVRSLAPWLRAFPSIREADDEASNFLVKAAELSATFDVVAAARVHALLSEADLEVFRQLRDAVDRGTFQGEKAGGRAKRSASNFVISAVTLLGSIYVGAIASDVATTSPLAHKAGQFLVSTEQSIEAMMADLPNDIRYSVSEFLKYLEDIQLVEPPSQQSGNPPPV